MLQLQQMRMLGQYGHLGLNNFNGHFGQNYPIQPAQEAHQGGHIDHDFGDHHVKMVSSY